MSSPPENTRLRILNAARTLLETNPGPGVRMVDIARAAGLSRQAVYLHFATRAELLRATTLHIDALCDLDGRLSASRAAASGRLRLREFVGAWGNYLPNIQGVASALLAMPPDDADAVAVWSERMADMREGCAAAIQMLAADGDLSNDWPLDTATDLLWTMLSFRNWDQLRHQCHWNQDTYIERLQLQADRLFVRQSTDRPADQPS